MRATAFIAAVGIALVGCTAITDVGRYKFGEKDGGPGIDGGRGDAAQPADAGATCGDGVTAAAETCDDGNLAAHDGCDGCDLEPGWSCDRASPSVCLPVCGDGMTVGSEVCDEGSANGCGSCNEDCTAIGSIGAVCGDGTVCSGVELCDDGFLDDCGTCNADCTAAGAGAVRDGLICPELEECDDGNSDGGDGCDPSGVIEDGWACTGEPSVCSPPACANDEDCLVGERCDISSSTCVACAATGEACSGSIACCSGICDLSGGTCVECVADSDCDDGSSCTTDACHLGGTCSHTAVETTCTNGLDDDCDGQVDCADTDCASCGCVDSDADGYTVCGGDCGDANPNVNPGEAEVCNSMDDDCDGTVDEGCSACTGALSSCAGVCVNLETDEMNCGSCGTTCWAMSHCVSGACVTCHGAGALCSSSADCCSDTCSSGTCAASS